MSDPMRSVYLAILLNCLALPTFATQPMAICEEILIEKEPQYVRYFSKMNPFFDVRAKLTDHGVLHFYVKTRNSEGRAYTGISGGKALHEIMKQFGSRVRIITGNWSWGDNLNAVNHWTTQGEPVESAIKRAWTATQAAKYGYTRIEVVDLRGETGNYKMIFVAFTKPEDSIRYQDIPKTERFVDLFPGENTDW